MRLTEPAYSLFAGKLRIYVPSHEDEAISDSLRTTP
jgi:hypothetical protein